jgi:hypothetical protein
MGGDQVTAMCGDAHFHGELKDDRLYKLESSETYGFTPVRSVPITILEIYEMGRPWYDEYRAKLQHLIISEAMYMNSSYAKCVTY